MSDPGGTAAGEARVYIVGETVIDLSGYEIRRGGEEVHVEPQVFEVVRYLLVHAGRVVTKDELLDNVWGTRFVSESSLTSRIKAARRALGDDGRRQHVIQTLHGRGYRWIAPFETQEAGSSARTSVDDRTARGAPAVGRALPIPLTPFIGRERELPTLMEAVGHHRLVTATGPGGVGKTRLAVAAAAALAPGFPDGVAFADLVVVSEPTMVVDALADGVGVVEGAQVDRREALHAALARRECLVVVDNCEHLLAAVRTAVEELLLACPGVRVLATSRIRLMVPFEHVFAVPGLAIGDDVDDGRSDAVELFVARMTDAGEPPDDDPTTLATITTICRSVDGMALGIELAAARAPGLGLDGLSQALEAQLPLLSMGRRTADHRHDSLRNAIDWTYRLLEHDERAALRAASVFAGPFEVAAVADVLERPLPVVLDALAGLVDWNLVTRRADVTGRFRVLETIRQFALEQAEVDGEAERLRRAHLDWVRRRLDDLVARGPADAAWCDEVDLVLPDGRAALRWAGARATERDAAGVAELLARVTFQRGRPAEAQARYEEAATWAPGARLRHTWLCAAAGAAAARNVGADTLSLLAIAADVAATDGRPDDAAVDLATAAIYRHRASGIIGHPVAEEGTEELIRRARDLSRGSPRATASIALAESWAPESGYRTRAGVEHALALARAVGDPLLVSAALDLWTVVLLDADDLDGAIGAIRQRITLLEDVPPDATAGFEFFDAYQMACRIEVVRGDFGSARDDADTLARLPFVREERHIAIGRRMEVDALAGDFAEAVRSSELFERDWVLAGRPMASNLAPSSYAIAMAHGLLGDDERRTAWVEITRSLFNPSKRTLIEEAGWGTTFDAVVDLHHDDPEAALARLTPDLDDPVAWLNPNRRVWRPWHAAIWAEASVLAGVPEAASRVERAAGAGRASRFAAAMVERARRIHRGDARGVRRLATDFEQLGARYQATRTHLLADALGSPEPDRAPAPATGSGAREGRDDRRTARRP